MATVTQRKLRAAKLTEIDTLRSTATDLLAEWNDHTEEMRRVRLESDRRYKASKAAQHALDNAIIELGDYDLGWLIKVGWMDDIDNPRRRELDKLYPAGGLVTYDGIDLDLGQRRFRVAIPKRSKQDTIDKVEDMITALRPHLKSHPDGYKYFGVYEHYLSEHGIVELRMCRKRVQVVKTVRGTMHVDTTGSLRKCLNRIAWAYNAPSY